jgi:hypothetical protein
LIGVILIEPPLNGTRRNCQRLTAGRGLDGFQIQIAGCARADQRVDFVGDFLFEDFFEAPFFAAAVASATSSTSCRRLHSSLASANCSATFQNFRPSSSCRLTLGISCSSGTVLMTVLPPTFLEMTQPP